MTIIPREHRSVGEASSTDRRSTVRLIGGSPWLPSPLLPSTRGRSSCAPARKAASPTATAARVVFLGAARHHVRRHAADHRTLVFDACGLPPPSSPTPTTGSGPCSTSAGSRDAGMFDIATLVVGHADRDGHRHARRRPARPRRRHLPVRVRPAPCAARCSSRSSRSSPASPASCSATSPSPSSTRT